MTEDEFVEKAIEVLNQPLYGKVMTVENGLRIL